jgi:hypothetical protein
MFLVSDMMGDRRRDVVDECDDVVDSATEGYAGSHLTPGTARLVWAAAFPRSGAAIMFTVLVALLGVTMR